MAILACTLALAACGHEVDGPTPALTQGALDHLTREVEVRNAITGLTRRREELARQLDRRRVEEEECVQRQRDIAEQLADTHEEEVNIAVGALGEALQPLVTIIIGVVVIMLALALFVPMVDMIAKLNEAGVSGGAGD